MKKAGLVLLFASVIAAGAFAGDIGVGASYAWFSDTISSSGPSLSTATESYASAPTSPVSVFGEIGGKYLELRVGYLEVNNLSYSDVQTDSVGDTFTTNYAGVNETFVTGAGFFKLPIDFGGISLFPMIGAEYDYDLTYTDLSGNDQKSTLSSQQLADLNQIWIKLGLGAQVRLGPLFIRPEVLYGFKIPSVTQASQLATENVDTGGGTGTIDTHEIEASVTAGFIF